MKIEKGYAAYEATKVTKQPLPPTSQEAKTAKKSIETTKSVDVDLSQASRADKVAAIKAAIKQGTYEISPEKIAKSMLEE